MTRSLLLLLGVLLATGCGGGSQDDDDPTGQTCGMCVSNCCCTGLNYECGEDEICGLDNHCESAYYHRYVLEVRAVVVAPTDAQGAPWDADSGPDLRLVVEIAGQQVLDTQLTHDDASWQGYEPLTDYTDGMNPNSAITIRVEEMDPDGPSTLIAEQKLLGVPPDVLKADEPVAVVTDSPLLQRLELSSSILY